jgi:hypothetical protein
MLKHHRDDRVVNLPDLLEMRRMGCTGPFLLYGRLGRLWLVQGEEPAGEPTQADAGFRNRHP